MKVAICGGTGFVGKHLLAHLKNNGDEAIVISRSTQASVHGFPCLSWDQVMKDASQLEGLDGLINLSGESISQRWTAGAKERILNSRLHTTSKVSQLVDKLERKPAVVLNGSGMSYYGMSESQTFDERSAFHRTDFLASVVEKWEHAAQQISGTRLVLLRIGLVLGKDGGALPKMALPYKMGVGGRVGSGKQWLSWIHMEDMVRLMIHCIEDNRIVGPVNMVGPDPVTNDEFGRALAKTLHRPHFFPVPSILMKLVFGELSILLLEGQKVLPRKALEHGFNFRFQTIESALQHIYGRSNNQE